MPAPSWAPRTVRSVCVVWAWTLRFSESAPLSVKPAWVEVAACRRANGVTKAPIPRSSDPVARLELAEEHVGRRLALGDAIGQAGDDDRPAHPVVPVGVAGQRIEIGGPLRELAVEAELQDVGGAAAGHVLGVERGRIETHRNAEQEAVVDLAAEAGGEAAEGVGCATGIGIACHGAGGAEAGAPGAPARHGGIAGDVAGLGQRDLAAVAAATVAGIEGEAIEEGQDALHRKRAETRVALAADRV